MYRMLRVGMCQIDITPPAPVSLIGQFHTRISEYVESPLYANVLAVESEDEQIIICSCDLLDISAEVCLQVRKLILEKKTNIDVSKIIFCTTHTHTGPAFYTSANTLHVAAKYLPKDVYFDEAEAFPEEVWLEDRCGAFISERLCTAVCEAWEKREPASYSPSFARAVVGHCRRVVYDDNSAEMYGSVDSANFIALEGGNDSGIELMFFFGESKQPLGVLVNVACPSQCVEMENYISSDYWGKVRDNIKRSLGDDYVVVGLCGAAGDQSPRDWIRKENSHSRRQDPDMYSLEGAIELGKRISAEVLAKFEIARQDQREEPIIRHETMTIDFPLRTVMVSEYNKAKCEFDDYVAKSGKKVFTSDDMSALHINGGIIDRFNIQTRTHFYSSEIHIIRFGDIVIATNPFELFLDYGNQIKARSAATQTILIQLACDSGGYLPTAKAEIGSHYSAYVSSGKTGHIGGMLLVSKTLDTIQKLWKNWD